MNKKQIISNALTICVMVFGVSKLSAQVGIGTTGTVNSKAALEVASTTKGFLPPRMTTTERDAISSPPNGLVIYNSSTNKYNVYENSVWSEMATTNTAETITGVKTFSATPVFSSGATFSGTTGFVNTTNSGTLGITGAATLGSTLGVTGATTLSSLSVGTTSAHTGAATFGSTVGITGATTLSSSLSVGTTSTHTGAATFGSTVGITGATTLSGTLDVTGASTFNNATGVTFGNATTTPVGIGVAAASINSKAAFEVASTTKGFLPPRMASSAITSPTAGLVIYNTTTNRLAVSENGVFQDIVTSQAAEVSFSNLTGVTTNASATPWNGTTTTSSGWTVISFQIPGTTLGTNSTLDSVVGAGLGARVNHNNSAAGAGVIAYYGTSSKRFKVSSSMTFVGTAASGSNMTNIAIGIFKNGTLLPESVMIVSNAAATFTISTSAITSLSANDYLDIRVAGNGGTASAALVFKSVNLSAHGL